jgi:hypothetical protein
MVPTRVHGVRCSRAALSRQAAGCGGSNTPATASREVD